MILFQAAVESADELAVQIDLRVAVQFVECEIAAGVRLERGAIEDVAVGLVDVLHAEDLFGVNRRGQVIPERSGFGHLDCGDR